MSKLTEISREQFNEYKKVKLMHSPLLGEHFMYGRKGNKYIAKYLDCSFISTRTASIPYYLTETKQKIYFFQQEGESIEGILQNKLISNRLNSKHNSSDLICWMTKYKTFEMNLWEIFKLGVKVITSSPMEMILGCFRIVRSKLVYHYESWLTSTESMVRDNIQQLQKYYFSERALKNIRDNQLNYITQREALYRLAFLILHIGTRDLNLRFYEYGIYQINQQNLIKRVELFNRRYPKLGQKIEHILLQMRDDLQVGVLEELSSINIQSTIIKNLCASSVNESKSIPRKSIQHSITKSNKISIIDNTRSNKQLKMRTEQCRVLEVQCSVLNILQKMKSITWGSILQTGQIPLLQYMHLQQYYPVTTYQQKLVRLLSKIHLKIIFSKKQYSNNSVYLGQLNGEAREGKGLYLFESGDIYYGDWKQNNMYGSGTYIFKNGDLYQGELYQGLKQGHGRNQYASGSVYEGSWISNHKKGLGVVYYKNGSMFIGEFFGNQKPAEGVYVGQDGNLLQNIANQQNTSPQRQSKFKKNQVNLKSSITQTKLFQDGQYSGQIVSDIRQGYGIFKSSGCTYQGNWKNDLKHGQGRLNSNGFTIEGVWENGLIIQYK